MSTKIRHGQAALRPASSRECYCRSSTVEFRANYDSQPLRDSVRGKQHFIILNDGLSSTSEASCNGTGDRDSLVSRPGAFTRSLGLGGDPLKLCECGCGDRLVDPLHSG
jgi:hypothetical protein